MSAPEPKILLLYTGGTVGMKSSQDGYVPMDNFADFLKGKLSPTVKPQLPKFDVVSLDILIDSANLVPANWTGLGEKLLGNWQKYKGFVVLHGTDTMAYTASALSFMFQGLDKTIVVTGSQIPLSISGSDALANIEHAMLLAAQQQIPEVCICFNGSILRGNRSTKYNATQLEAFTSPNYPSLGQVKEQISLQKQMILGSNKLAFVVPQFKCNTVLVLQVYPGISTLEFDSIFSNNDFKAVIIQTYGMGNTPSMNSSLIRLLEQAYRQDIVVLNITQCMIGSVHQGVYSTGETMNKLGVVAGKDMTLEAAFSKLHFLIASGLTSNKVRRELTVELCGELTH